MKKIMACVGAIVAAVFILSGCSASISEGTVVNKTHEDGYYYTTMMCSVYDKNGFCTSYVPIQNYNPESWEITISGKDDEGSTVTANYSVSESRYETIEIGAYVSFGE